LPQKIIGAPKKSGELPEDELNFIGPRKAHPRYKKFFDLLASGKKKGFLAAQLSAETGKPVDFLDQPDEPIAPQHIVATWPRKLHPKYSKFFDQIAAGKNRGFVVAALKAETGKAGEFLDHPDDPVGNE
jgi:hypothetical protein